MSAMVAPTAALTAEASESGAAAPMVELMAGPMVALTAGPMAELTVEPMAEQTAEQTAAPKA